MPQDVVLQAVLLALVIGLHQPQPRHVHVEVHLFADALVSGAQRLDLGIGERRLVNILTASHRGFAGHDLGDEFLLIFHRLPEVSVEGRFRDIAVDVYLLVAVALPDDAPAALLQITRPPRAVEVVERHEPVLHVHARAHFEGAAHEHTHLTGAHLCE